MVSGLKKCWKNFAEYIKACTFALPFKKWGSGKAESSLKVGKQ